MHAMEWDSMEKHGHVAGPARLRPKSAQDVAPGFALIQEHGALLDGQDPAEGGTAANQLSQEQLGQVWTPWRRTGSRGTDYQLTIEEALTSGFRGSLVIRSQGRGLPADLGYWVDPAHWGRGLGGGAVRLALWWTFSCLEAPDVSALVQTGNPRSRRLLEGLGFRVLGPVPGHGEPLLAYHLTGFRWAELEGAWSPSSD